MLLFVEALDTITGVFILTKLCLVFGGIELGLVIPGLAFQDVH
jgi:hypothetical protein